MTMIDPLSDDLIPFSQLAERFQVTPKTVANWHVLGVKRGAIRVHLEAVRVGAKWYTTAVAVEEFAQSRARPIEKTTAYQRQVAHAKECLRAMGIKVK